MERPLTVPSDFLGKFRDLGGEPASARRYPGWVRIFLFPPRTRCGQWFYFWLFVALAVVGSLLGIWFRDPFAVLFVLVVSFSATLDWLAIRWIDTHGSWAEIG